MVARRTGRQAAPARGGAWIERPLWQVGFAAALVAAAASVIVYVAARAAGVPMELTEVFEDQSARMPVTNMAWAALLEGVLAGTALAAACRPWTGRPRSCFVALAVAGLIASFALPITSDASTATKVVLAIATSSSRSSCQHWHQPFQAEYHGTTDCPATREMALLHRRADTVC
jgi:Family of unknown function (DUF6069)